MKTVVVFSGAGISQESGIPTFRDSNGLWENHKVEDVASPEGWERSNETVLRFYEQRFNNLKNCEPNEAHKALARLEEKYRVVHYTQNIDDLFERAGCTEVNHLHGSLMQRKCEHHNGISNLDGDTNFTCDYLVDHVTPVQVGEKCPKCDGQLRPNVVWFGEAVDMNWKEIHKLMIDARDSDGAFICVGTSAQVYPAASLLEYFASVKKKYIVDINVVNSPYTSFLCLKGKASDHVPRIVDKLLGDA